MEKLMRKKNNQEDKLQEHALADYNLSKEIYIGKDVVLAIINKWEPLLFPEENHVFMEMIKDDWIFRIITIGPVLLEHIKNGSILENKDSEAIQRVLKEGKGHEYKVKIKNSIAFEVLKIQSSLDDQSVVAETMMIKDNFFPGSTMPFVISNFLKNVQRAYGMLATK